MRVLLLMLFCSAASADPLDRLYARIAADLREGRPLRVKVHVALCDNTIISCGGHGLGDGDDLRRNLYWSSSGGLRGWFERRGSGWGLIAHEKGTYPGVLEQVVYRRHLEPSARFRGNGVTRGFDVEVTAVAWRGRDIDRALDAFLSGVFGGDAHVVAYVGHNGWMDRDSLGKWPLVPPDAPPTGAIAIACLTRSYLKDLLSERTPLLLTRDLLFAGSHALDGAVQAVARGASLAEIREQAARFYAEGEGKSFQRVRGAFTNPSDPRY